jgi:RHS repeat-associated protein
VIYDGAAEYSHGGPGGILSERRGGATSWYHADGLQSTRGLTSGAQTVTGSADYDAWGNPVNTAGSLPTSFLHKGGQGYQRDADSGLLLLGRRYYDPAEGRFLSRDPIGYGGKDPNLYRYAGNNPVNAGDPSGMWLDTVIDVVGLVFDVVDFASDPSWEGAGWILVGVGAMVIPGVVNPRIVGRLWNGAEWMKKTMNKPPIGCFPAGTPVLMADGTQKPIEKVKVGERVASAGEWSGDSGYSKVAWTFKRPHDTLLVIRTEDGKKIEATPEHPFWVEGRGFVAARRLARSDLLRAEDGRNAAITSITERRGRFTVYNLEVEGTHTYYAGEAGWWVHNDCTDVAKGFQDQFGGDIYRIQHKEFEDGKWLGEHGWWYHEVHVKDGYVWDPMKMKEMGNGYDKTPIPIDEYMKMWKYWEEYDFFPKGGSP